MLLPLSVLRPRLRAAPAFAASCAASASRCNRRPRRLLATASAKPAPLSLIRNIGISAHIDSGKTTLTERILYYSGRIAEMHEVKGRDNHGATMDSMDLERERGITIQSAATYARWNDCHLNIIDTPGHIDFTIEVERALRVLDGAVLVLCGVSGVQSQTFTVDRQMRRYNVPRLVFVNKLDRAGANPDRALHMLRTSLRMPTAAVQLNVGAEDSLKGIVDVIRGHMATNGGRSGEIVERTTIPPHLASAVADRRRKLIETLADADDEIAEYFLEDKDPTQELIIAAIRRATIARKFVPLFMGSAYKNIGVQLLLDGVCDYLPAPNEVLNVAVRPKKMQAAGSDKNIESIREDINPEPSAFESRKVDDGHDRIELVCDNPNLPLVVLAFKLEEGRYGQLTYVRVYQGTLSRGMNVLNTRTKKRVRISRLVRVHANNLEDVESISAGEICALFGIECASGDTFTLPTCEETANVSMSPMFVPEPVVSLALKVGGNASGANSSVTNMSRALGRFQREDPTFRASHDKESKELIISGMGELHLEIYVERMRREYRVECSTGRPRVAYRETITKKTPFKHTFKRQNGGNGMYARVEGFIEPIFAAEASGLAGANSAPNIASSMALEFESRIFGATIPSSYIPACERGFRDVAAKGNLAGMPMAGLRMVLEDGQHHAVDSNELAFRVATILAFYEAYAEAGVRLLEPVMSVDVAVPREYLGDVIAGLNKRRALITNTEDYDMHSELHAEVPLSEMFGYSTAIRSATQGKGEFSMEYLRHDFTLPSAQEEIATAYRNRTTTTADEGALALMASFMGLNTPNTTATKKR